MKPLLTSVASIALVCTSTAEPAHQTAAPAIDHRLTPAACANEQMITRSYKINAEKFVRNLRQWTPTPIQGESNRDLFVRFLKENKVEIANPSSLALLLNEKNGTVFVHSSETVLDQIPALIEKAMNYVETAPRELSRIEQLNDDDIFSIGDFFDEMQAPKRDAGAFAIPRSYNDDQPLMRRYQQGWETFLKSPNTAFAPTYNPSRVDSVR